jgi:hypothetical protein
MRALVVYESMYGNTRAIAASVAAGLRATHEVTLVPATAWNRRRVSSYLARSGPREPADGPLLPFTPRTAFRKLAAG